MWDVMVLIPDHCLSFYFTSSVIINFEVKKYHWKCFINPATLICGLKRIPLKLITTGKWERI